MKLRKRSYMKRAVAIILVLIMALSLTSCGGLGEEVAVTIGGTDISSDVYAYYLDMVLQGDDNLSKSAAIEETTALCREYVEINTEFSKQGLSLSSAEKAILATEVNDLWSMYGGYYESIGVSKQTLTKVKESEAYKETLVTAIFGEGGEKAVSADDQKAYFAANHVFFKAISAYLYTTNDEGEVVKLPSADLTALKTKFDDMKASITAENTIDAVNKSYEESNGGTAESEMPILSTTKTSTLYPEGFFDAVLAMETDTIEVLVYDTYYFLVQKKSADNYYNDYSYENLLEMVSTDFTKELDSRYTNLKVENHKSAQENCYDIITEVKDKSK